MHNQYSMTVPYFREDHKRDLREVLLHFVRNLCESNAFSYEKPS